jgi:NADH dehydrogenase FAD-containing subunit
LALAQLAPDLTDAIVIAPNSEFIDRPMTLCEPFAYGMAHHYPVAEIVHAVGANVLTGELARIDLRARTVRTQDDQSLHYDALLLALGAKMVPRYEHAHESRRSHLRTSIPSEGRLVIHPGDRRLRVDRVVALPELYGPSLRGIPLAEHGFVRVDQHQRVPNVGPVYAAGDVTQFAIKHGALASQQADAAAESIAALAGVSVTRSRFTRWYAASS